MCCSVGGGVWVCVCVCVCVWCNSIPVCMFLTKFRVFQQLIIPCYAVFYKDKHVNMSNPVDVVRQIARCVNDKHNVAYHSNK